VGNDLMPGYSSAVQSLKLFELAGLEAARFALDFFYNSGLDVKRSGSRGPGFELPLEGDVDKLTLNGLWNAGVMK
jgi:hypothetical protein